MISELRNKLVKDILELADVAEKAKIEAEKVKATFEAKIQDTQLLASLTTNDGEKKDVENPFEADTRAKVFEIGLNTLFDNVVGYHRSDLEDPHHLRVSRESNGEITYVSLAKWIDRMWSYDAVPKNFSKNEVAKLLKNRFSSIYYKTLEKAIKELEEKENE